jgi:hypothetical protein
MNEVTSIAHSAPFQAAQNNYFCRSYTKPEMTNMLASTILLRAVLYAMHTIPLPPSLPSKNKTCVHTYVSPLPKNNIDGQPPTLSSSSRKILFHPRRCRKMHACTSPDKRRFLILGYKELGTKVGVRELHSSGAREGWAGTGSELPKQHSQCSVRRGVQAVRDAE